MQILEYMKINSIHPNKAKLLRTEKEWFDPDNEKDDMEVSSKLIKVTSSASLSGLSHNGRYTHTAYRLVKYCMLYLFKYATKD